MDMRLFCSNAALTNACTADTWDIISLLSCHFCVSLYLSLPSPPFLSPSSSPYFPACFRSETALAWLRTATVALVNFLGLSDFLWNGMTFYGTCQRGWRHSLHWLVAFSRWHVSFPLACAIGRRVFTFAGRTGLVGRRSRRAAVFCSATSGGGRTVALSMRSGA